MKKQHNFTWKGKPVTARTLAIHLGCVTQTIYSLAKKAKSDVGEDLAMVFANKNTGGPRVEIWWEGEKTEASEVAEKIGVERATLLTRLRKWGHDGCLTYYPGRIPRKLILDVKPDTTNRGSEEFQKLGLRPRSENLDKIKLGKWELAQC